MKLLHNLGIIGTYCAIVFVIKQVKGGIIGIVNTWTILGFVTGNIRPPVRYHFHSPSMSNSRKWYSWWGF